MPNDTTADLILSVNLNRVARWCLLLIGMMLNLLSAADTPQALPLMRLDDYQAGALAAQERCLLVFSDGRYHAERIVKRRDEPRQGAASEGTLSPEDLQRLHQILDNKEFAALTTPNQKKLLVVEDLHLLDISVARSGGWQSVVYQSDSARKHDNNALRPLLGWWKDFERSARFSLAATNRCSYQNQ